jgi:predicted metal-dependent hydrolase
MPDYSAAIAACDEPLSAAAIGGIALFNQRQFYEAHHGLEDAWNADQGPGRDLYRAILQVAVAYLQIERRNYRGATKMFLRVRQWLEPLPDICRGVDVARLRDDAEAAFAALQELGTAGIAEFDENLLKPVVFVQSGDKAHA